MTGPRNASTGWEGHRSYKYRDADYPSVTSILKLGRPQPWMGPWAAKEVGQLAVACMEDGLSIVQLEELDRGLHEATKTHIDRHKNKCPYQPSAIGYLKSSPWRKRDKAADAGTERHETLEALSMGETLPEDAPGREQIEAWRDAYRPRFVETEFQVVNTEHGYAGSGDLIADIYGRRILLDLKTSKLFDGQGKRKSVPRDWSLQLAAYLYAERIFLDDESWPMTPVEDCAVLWIPSDAPEQWMFVNVPANGAEFAAFLAAKHTHDDHVKYERTGTPATIILPQAVSVEEVSLRPRLRVLAGG